MSKQKSQNTLFAPLGNLINKMKMKKIRAREKTPDKPLSEGMNPPPPEVVIPPTTELLTFPVILPFTCECGKQHRYLFNLQIPLKINPPKVTLDPINMKINIKY